MVGRAETMVEHAGTCWEHPKAAVGAYKELGACWERFGSILGACWNGIGACWGACKGVLGACWSMLLARWGMLGGC